MNPADGPDAPGLEPGPPPETIARAVLERADDSGLGLWTGDLRLSHAEVVAACGAAWGLAALWARAGGGALPRRRPARQRPRVRLLARGGRVDRCRGRGGQPDAPGRRARARPEPHRVPVLGDRFGLAAAARGGAAGRTRRRRARTVSADNPRVLVVDTPAAQAALEAFDGASAADVRRPLRDARIARATCSSRRARRARPRRACAPRAGWPASGRSWRRCSR